MFTGALLLHACGVARNWRTYFINVRRVFLVETVVLQTALWDIRAWSTRYLVFIVDFNSYIDDDMVSTDITVYHDESRLLIARMYFNIERQVVRAKGIKYFIRLKITTTTVNTCSSGQIKTLSAFCRSFDVLLHQFASVDKFFIETFKVNFIDYFLYEFNYLFLY